MTSRPNTLWPEIWKDMYDASKRKEKQQWAIEKPRLDNAGKLRGIDFIDPADDFKDIMKKTRVESCKFRCQLQCPAKLDARSTGRPVPLRRSARQTTLALSKPTSLRESAWKDLFIIRRSRGLHDHGRRRHKHRKKMSSHEENRKWKTATIRHDEVRDTTGSG